MQRIPALKQYVLGCGRTTSNILMKLGGMIQYGRADLNLAVYVKYIGIHLGFGNLIVRKSENNYPAREIKYASRWASLLTGLWCVFFPVKSPPHPPRPSWAHSPAGNALFSPRARMRTMKRFVLYSLRKIVCCLSWITVKFIVWCGEQQDAHEERMEECCQSYYKSNAKALSVNFTLPWTFEALGHWNHQSRLLTKRRRKNQWDAFEIRLGAL